MLTGAVSGAIGGAAFAGIDQAYGGDWSMSSWHRPLVHGVAGGALAEMQGGDFGSGFGWSAGSAIAMMAWEGAKNFTDKHYLKGCEANGEIPISDDGLYRTDGTTKDDNYKGDYLEDLHLPKMENQGTRNHWYDQKSSRYGIRKLIVQISKFHDAGNGWGYNKSGGMANYSKGFNTIHGVWSYGTMLPAAALTGVAFSAATYQPMIYMNR